jgi:ABC-type phosphate transport system substrate-binding protein
MPRLLAAALLLTALLAAGCGGDDNASVSAPPTATSSAATETATAPAPAATTTAPTTTSTDGATSTLPAGRPLGKRAVASCKQGVDANPQIKDEIKSDVKAICEKLASGDAAEVRKAIRDVCVKIVDSSIPAGDAREQAEKSCSGSGGD